MCVSVEVCDCCTPKAAIKKETLAQVFSCEFCEISKNNFFCRTPPVTASNFSNIH